MTTLGGEQQYEAAGADTAHPDHFDGGIIEAIPVEQYPSIVGHRGAVGVEKSGRNLVGELGRVVDQRRLIADAQTAALSGHQLGEQVLGDPLAGLLV